MKFLKKVVIAFTPDIKNIPKKIKGIRLFIRDWSKYKNQAKKHNQLLPSWEDLYLQLDDRFKESGGIPGHYFLQDLWAARLVYESKKDIHYDVGSSIAGFIAHISLFCQVKVIDIRPQISKFRNIEFIQGDITNMSFADNSISSLSCLHVAEHIGLGRYGDTVDPLGTIKAAKELQRVLAVNGDLYFSVPVGRERICFNAHRVFSPKTILNYFDKLSLQSFSLISDSEEFIENCEIQDLQNADYSCGLFHFKKIKQ